MRWMLAQGEGHFKQTDIHALVMCALNGNESVRYNGTGGDVCRIILPSTK
jgi:hypothetical protein